MSEDTSYLLTDEFIAFTTKVREIHEKKKTKKAELKAVYDKIQEDIKALEAEAKQLEADWQKVKLTLKQ